VLTRIFGHYIAHCVADSKEYLKGQGTRSASTNMQVRSHLDFFVLIVDNNLVTCALRQPTMEYEVFQ
jgi:hypothetical protein